MDESEQQPKTNTDVILSGVLIGPSAAGETSQVGVDGIAIGLVPNGKGAVTKTTVSGLGGDFSSGLITPAKYKLYFKDPTNKYSHPPMPLTVGQDMDIPIYMYPSGGQKRRRGKGYGYQSSTISGTVFAYLPEGKKRLERMNVKIQSIKIEGDNLARKLISSFFKRIAGEKNEQDNQIIIERVTNAFGMFFSDRILPKGTYNVYCSDPEGTYFFSTKFVVVKSATVAPLVFLGYTKKQLEEYKKQKTEAQNKPEEPPKETPPERKEQQAPGQKASDTHPVDNLSEETKIDVKTTVISPKRGNEGPEDPRLKWRPVSEKTYIANIPHQTSSEIINQTRAQAASEHATEVFRQNEKVSVHPAGQTPGPTFTNAPTNYTNMFSSVPPYSVYVNPRVSQTRSRGGGTINTVNKLNNTGKNIINKGQQASKLAQKVASSPLKWWLLGVGIAIILFLVVFEGGVGSSLNPFGGGGSPEQTIAQTTPAPGPTANCATSGSLDYTIPYKNPAILPQNAEVVKQEVLAQFPNAQIQNWDTIVNQSVANGWNPAFVLTLWIEESGAQGAPGYTDALGCEPTNPTTDINRSLHCLFTSFPDGKFSPAEFDDFMCTYGGDGFHRSPCTFNTENPNFPPNIKSWYSKLTGGVAAAGAPASCNTQPLVNSQGTGWPTSGTLTQGPLGALDHAGIKSSTGHDSLDIADPSAPAVTSPFNGFVSATHNCIASGDCSLHYGNSVEITTNAPSGSFVVKYGHFANPPDFNIGQDIKAGQTIGTMGTTGNSTGIHLHWEFMGIPMEPPYIPQAINPLNCDTPSIPCTPTSVSPNAPSSQGGPGV